MKAILSFNLDEEKEEFHNAVNGSKYRGIIEDFDNYLRAELKYTEHSKEIDDIYQLVRDKLNEFVSECNEDLLG